MPAIGQSWVHVVRDVEGMKDYNWAKLTLDCLVEGIHNCKTKGHLKANGFLFLLALFYLDRVTPVGSHDVHHPSTPCLVYWGDAKIKQTLKLFEASGERDKKSKAQTLAEVPRDISMEFEKHATSNAETVASSPAAIEKVDVIVLSSDTQEESKLSQKKSAQLPKNTARRGRPYKNNLCEVVSCINDSGRRTRLSKDRVLGPNIHSPYILCVISRKILARSLCFLL
ncbi:hypothetical protein Vadar_015332 [Vaccinium darrowii]|uniref:Uncharacterized protein n=1 Tax=Vaccinium darrowii TaxID=229202 RepID=A0ACB7XQV7_9ERIC|nr:hypothetical protein Vadar_015332 [Vaccinium darrowii]